MTQVQSKVVLLGAWVSLGGHCGASFGITVFIAPSIDFPG